MKTPFYLLFLLLIGGVSLPAYAQKALYIGTINEVAAQYKTQSQSAANKGANPAEGVRYRMPGYDLLLRPNASKTQGTATLFFGDVATAQGGRFYLKLSAQEATGSVVLTEQKKFYRFSSTAEGLVYLTEEDIDKVLCVGLPETPAPSATAQTANRAAAVPDLESLPGAGAVLYLDFDGQTVSNTIWNATFTSGNPIVAAPANLTLTEMSEVWKLMSEDYRPFALNVTTSEAIFNSAPANRRMRVVFTPTNYFYPNAGGAAYVGSFTWGGTANGETPGWVFNTTSKNAGEAGSHESGHTMGLSHDGRITPAEEYFLGQGSWAPIMGAGYYRPQSQFSKGEYPSANNTEDDLVKISTQNGFGYRADDHGDNMGTATALVQDAGGNASATANKGVITTRADVDAFRLSHVGGPIVITVNPDPDYPDLDVLLTLRNAGGTIVATADPATQGASLNLTLTAGTYYLSVDGGTGSLGANSDYASLGAYAISVAVTNNPPTVSLTAPAGGATFVAPATVNIAATAADADGSVAKVEFFQGATKLGEDLTAPYAYSWTGVSAGTYSLTAKATDNLGAATTSAAVSITVTDQTPPVVQQVISYMLVNADTDLDIQPLANGAVLNLAALPTRNLNVRANTNPATVGSVVFTLSGAVTHGQTENVVPYALFSDVGGDYSPWTPAVGKYSLTARPYTGGSGTGTAGTALAIAFTVTDQTPRQALTASAAVPVHTPQTPASAYPNPSSNGQFRVQLPNFFEGAVSYRLVSVLGATIASGTLTTAAEGNGLALDFSHSMLATGAYYLLLENDQRSVRLKLMRE